MICGNEIEDAGMSEKMMSDELYDLLSGILNSNPENRYDLETVLNHKWVKESIMPNVFKDYLIQKTIEIKENCD